MSARTPKRLRQSIRFDAINPADYLKYKLASACEECTHFHHKEERCTLGYETKWHRQEFQKKSYDLKGEIAICRFMEID